MEIHQGRKALVAGASGLVGSELLNLLLSHPAYESVHVLVRKPLDRVHPRLTQVVVDFGNLPLATIPASDDAFCTLGTTIKKAGSQAAFTRVDLDYVRDFALLSHANSAGNFVVVSSMGANAHSSIFYSRIKGLMEEAVSKIPFRSVVILRPSLLMGNRSEYRFGEKMAIAFMKTFGFLFSGPLLKYKGVEAKTVAAAMIEAALANKTGLEVMESDKIQKAVR